MFAASKSGSVDAKDPQFKNVTMLLHGNGTNGAQNNTFVDSSTNNFTITRNGNTTQGTFTPYGSNWSNYFGGSSDYLSTPASANMNIGTGDFTYESWIYPTSYSSARAMISFANVNVFYLNTSGIPYYGIYLVSDTAIGTTAVSLNTWSHIAFVRSGTTLTCYINGTSVGSITTASSIGTSVNTNYLGYHQGGNYWSGYISNARVVKGTAVYTGNFTPSTTPLTAITNTQLLTCQSNRFIDNSSNAFALTVNGSPSVQRFSPFAPSAYYSTSVIGGSAYFDGNDYITPAVSSATTVGTSDFTIEFWVYPTGSTTTSWNPILSMGASGGGQEIRISQNINGTGYGYLIPNSSNNADIFVGFGTLTLNTWHHIALVRNGSTVTFYRNGVVIGTTTGVGFNFTNTGTFYIGYGQYPSDGYFPGGYISNFRLVKGTAVYTSAFTPPAAPLTAISNTSLLLSNTNAGILDNAMMNDLETVGNAQISTSVKKYGTGSMYFDGTGDYLISNSATTDLYAFGTGDFTIEMWVNFAVVGSSSVYTLYDSRPNGGQGAYASIALDRSTAKIYYYVSSAIRITGTTTIVANTWYHIAICRSGTSTKLFVNGTQEGSTWTDSTAYLNPANRPVIAASGSSIGNEATNGYIDDLRITKGVARYTANFTPPTAAFPNN